MKDEKEPSSLQQVALPAQGQCGVCGGSGRSIYIPYRQCSACNGTGRGRSCGAPDSRSDTLSPREWPTLETERDFYEKAAAHFIKQGDTLAYLWCSFWASHYKRKIARRHRRPRGESGE
jgi:hypothetical protein